MGSWYAGASGSSSIIMAALSCAFASSFAICVWASEVIFNEVCPYCRQRMINAENHLLSKSVEHLILNAALSRKRGKGEGDFYACRKCNSEKSNIDYVLGVIAKGQSYDEDFAFQSIWKALDDKKRNKRFIKMIIEGEHKGDLVQMPLPIVIF